MRRLARVGLMAASALIVPALPAAPAFAATNVICVNNPSGVVCNQTAGTIQAAITAANANLLDDSIVVAPGTYTEAPYVLDGTTIHGQVTLRGSGQGQTILKVSAGGSPVDVVSANGATVQDVTITMPVRASSTNDEGLVLSNGHAVRVTVDGTGTIDATGVDGTGSVLEPAELSDSTVTMPLVSSRGVYGGGGLFITDTAITGSQGFVHSGGNSTDHLSRVRVTSGSDAVQTDSGTVDIDDALIDLTSGSGNGLLAANFNSGTPPMAIDANHVTVVGGGAGSVGVFAWAAGALGAQQASVTLVNSIVRGPVKSLYAQADHLGTATISASYSDWSTVDEVTNNGSSGTAQILHGAGNLDNVDPGFVGGGDYHLGAVSALIDKGAPGTAAPTLDLDKAVRVLDGDGDGAAVRDLGAYERPQKVVVTPDTTAPDTTITSHPRRRTTKARAVFGFVSSEAGSTFQCKLDRHAWQACTSPRTYKVRVGWHRFQVRAIDAAHNMDAAPATFRWHRVS